MKPRIIVTACLALAVMGPAFLVAADPPPPQPGELLVFNDMHLIGDGSCEGNLSLSHAPLATDPLGRIVLKIRPTCAVEILWQDADNGLLQGQPTHYSVRTEFNEFSHGSYVSLAGSFTHSTNECPVPVPGGATILHSTDLVPGKLYEDGSLKNATPEASGPTQTTEIKCDSIWLQYWTALSESDFALYIAKSEATQVDGPTVSIPYPTYSCYVNGKTNATDPRVHCERWPDDVPRPTSWGEETLIGTVEPDEFELKKLVLL